ncbi:myosin-9-like [Canna indica]|uniref:Myosin-9-like n=1 Tax=Canna indica TaxID=4628 RepID=A0AAQ3K1A1_9LILI|nr:myosin-9-like [Canna indica]
MIGGELLPSPGQVDEAAYPIYFGVVCAFVALHMSRRRELRLEETRRSHAGDMMLRGSAHLLGLLVEKAQRRREVLEAKLRKAGSEVEELKRRRTEDAKANEKVVSIFAAREQSWIAERKSLRHQIQALLKELCNLKSSNDESISNLKKRLQGEEELMATMNESLEEESKRRKDSDKKLELAEQAAEELRERLKKEAQGHSDELWKHKTTLMELLSNQCRMESKINHALEQFEAAKENLKEVIQQKEEADAMVEKLSGDVAKIQRDCEQKDKILSAMLRKSKIDTAEKQMLLKEVNILKVKKRQAELEIERWRKIWESKHKKSSRALRSREAGCSQEAHLQLESKQSNPKNLLSEYREAEGRKDRYSSTSKTFDLNSSDENDEPEILGDSFRKLQDWARNGIEKYATIVDQKHYAEIEAFIEQMRQKDEKLEGFQRQILGRELEIKLLQDHIEGLDGNLSHLREENFKLEALLLDKEKEIKLLKEQLSFLLQHCQKSHLIFSGSPEACQQKALFSEVKIKERKSKDRKKVSKAKSMRNPQKPDMKISSKNSQIDTDDTRLIQMESNKESEIYRDSKDINVSTTNLENSGLQTTHDFGHDKYCSEDLSAEQAERAESSLQNQAENICSMALHSLKEEIKEVKEVPVDPGNSNKPNSFQEDAQISILSSPKPLFVKEESSWKKDIHALGVSYNIKRLKQQLLVLEKLAGVIANKQLTTMDATCNTPEANDRKIDENKQKMKGFFLMKSLLNKQVKRYQSLEEKTDDLCRRTRDNYRLGSRRDSWGSGTKEQTETLKCYLEETFQLQKYIVATGQKFMETQAKINSSFFGADAHDKSIGFNLRQFADIIRTIFRQVQKGLEMRIAQIIGDLEGKLACDSILQR